MEPVSNSDTATPYQEAPGPWNCEGEAFWLFGYDNGKQYPGPSSFSPLEGASAFADPETSGAFIGGLSSIMIVRYTKTPVGEYSVRP